MAVSIFWTLLRKTHNSIPGFLKTCCAEITKNLADLARRDDKTNVNRLMKMS